MLRQWHVPFCTCLQSLGEKEKASVEVLSANVETLTPFLGLDKQLLISQLLFFGLFFTRQRWVYHFGEGPAEESWVLLEPRAQRD